MKDSTLNKIKVATVLVACLIVVFAFIDRISSSHINNDKETTTILETAHNPEKTSVETTTELDTYLSCMPIETTYMTEKMTTVETTIYVEPVVYFNVPLDEDLQDHIFAECEKYNINPAIIIAMIERETDFRPHLIGDNGNSYGLMQINKKWHIERMKKLGCDDLLDPYQNVTVGIDYFAELYEYGGTLEWALMGYNGGYSYARKKTAKGEVSDYAKGVIERSEYFNEERKMAALQTLE